MIRVVIADDHRLVREGLAALLSVDEELAVAALVGDGTAALEAVEEHSPDVVLLDLNMPILGGLGVLMALRDRAFETRAMILTTFDDSEAMLQAAALGAAGFMLKDLRGEELRRAVREVAAGGRVFLPTVSDTVREASTALSSPASDRSMPISDLTEREVEVLRLVAGGLANKQVAAALELSEGTVKNHVSSILLKLDVADRTRAVLKALERGLL